MTRTPPPLLLLLLLAALAAPCCHTVTAPAASVGPAVVIKNSEGKQWTVTVEMARTKEEQQQGLMWRWSLEPDHGMLFMYNEPAQHVFWMRNTRIPLDMVFIRSDHTIAGVVANATPYTDDSRTVNAPSQWVLEVGGGECAKHGVQAGDRVYFFNLGEK